MPLKKTRGEGENEKGAKQQSKMGKGRWQSARVKGVKGSVKERGNDVRLREREGQM